MTQRGEVKQSKAKDEKPRWAFVMILPLTKRFCLTQTGTCQQDFSSVIIQPSLWKSPQTKWSRFGALQPQSSLHHYQGEKMRKLTFPLPPP